MSRFFNGGNALESIAFSIGKGPVNQGGITMAALVQANATNFTGNAINGYDSGGFAKFGLLAAATNPSRMFVQNDAGAGGPVVGTNWCWMVSTHAAGGGVPRHHRYDFTAGTWQHVDGTASVPDLSGTAATILLGNATGGTASTGWQGWMAAAALFPWAMSDAEVQAAFTLKAADLYAAGPTWGVLLNQSSTATAVADFTGNGGNQTALTGTSAATSVDPPGWDYTLPQVLFTSQVPQSVNNNDASPETLGTTITVKTAGNAVAARFLAPTTLGSGTYEIALWQATHDDTAPAGTLLATADFTLTKMTGGAWCVIKFATPVALDPTKVYRVGIRTSEGRYAASNTFFANGGPGLTNGNLYAPGTGETVSGVGAFNNGVYATSITGYPSSTFVGSCYFVDVLFTAAPSGPTVTVWNGTAEVAVASVTVWNGTAEVAASVASVV